MNIPPDKPHAVCARCQQSGVKFATTWPEGRICRRCYQRATRIHGACISCGTTRLLPGLIDGEPACVDCADIPKDFRCTRCGREDEPVRRGLCAHCCLTDDLSGLLAGDDGDISPIVRPLFDALSTQTLARSATIWLTVNPAAKQLLRDLATGAAPLTHDTFTTHPSPEKVLFLRQLCIEHGLLERVNFDIERFQAWVDQMTATEPASDARLIRQFARWVHLQRMHALDTAGKMRKGTFLSAKQSTSTAIGFLRHLRERGHTPSECVQADVDDWLTGGPTTRSLARTFVRWGVKNGHIASVEFPYRVAKTQPIITQQQRVQQRRTLLNTHVESATTEQVAGMLFLLYAQPLTRIARMRLSQVADAGDRLTVSITADELVVPPPFDEIVRAHLRDLPNTNTSAHRNSQWLFPGARPGEPMHQSTMMNKLRDRGIDLRGARNAALRTLVLEMPAPIVADSLGYSYNVTDRHRVAAGAVHTVYVGRHLMSRK